MTINEAINQIDALKPNTISTAIKTRWLSTLDLEIQQNIIDTHESETESSFDGYTEHDVSSVTVTGHKIVYSNTPGGSSSTDTSTVLLVPAPYDEMYILYLRSQIDYAYEEYAKYNNSNAMFLAAYAEFERWYNRTHMPKSKSKSFF